MIFEISLRTTDSDEKWHAAGFYSVLTENKILSCRKSISWRYSTLNILIFADICLQNHTRTHHRFVSDLVVPIQIWQDQNDQQ